MTMTITMTTIIGFVGTERVMAYIYSGADNGLNHFIWKGKTYSGNVKFTTIEKKIITKR